MSEAEHQLFGAQWCALALAAANESLDLQAGLADPGSFTMTMTFECTDHPELSCAAQFRSGQVQAWAPGRAGGDGYVATTRASAAVWRSAAEGAARATDLLLGHKIKIKDPRNRIASNYNAFDALLASWMDIPTVWP